MTNQQIQPNTTYTTKRGRKYHIGERSVYNGNISFHVLVDGLDGHGWGGWMGHDTIVLDLIRF